MIRNNLDHINNEEFDSLLESFNDKFRKYIKKITF